MTNTPVLAAPPSTWEERLKRALFPPRWELWRITWRELRRGEPELRLLPFLLDRRRAAMDIGANRGIWAGQMARFCETVWAFEPNPKLFAVLRAGAPAKVRCFPEALSDAAGETELMVPGEGGHFSNQGASLSRQRVGDRPFIRVPVKMARLDDLEPPPTGFLKIDVEGHERAVLEGARGLIARDRPTMVIEIEERHTGRKIEEEVAFVESLGYRAMVLKHGRLVGIQAFDADADHRALAGRRGYINNFIFLPVD